MPTVEIPDGVVTAWNLHLSTAISQRGWEAQRETLAAVAGEIGGKTGPLIILGDLNTTDQTENYRLIADQLTDIHWAVGRGFGFTFPDTRRYVGESPLLGPVVRIDHVLVSEHFAPQEIHVASGEYGSDHWPVVATLRFAS